MYLYIFVYICKSLHTGSQRHTYTYIFISKMRLGCVSLVFTWVHESVYSYIAIFSQLLLYSIYSEILLHILKISLFILVHSSVYSCIIIHCQYIRIYSQNIHISVYPYIFSEVLSIFVPYYTF